MSTHPLRHPSSYITLSAHPDDNGVGLMQVLVFLVSLLALALRLCTHPDKAVRKTDDEIN